jgi:DNA-binding MarR family transcriptional regulator
MNFKKYTQQFNWEDFVNNDKQIKTKKINGKFIPAMPFEYFENTSKVSGKAWVLFTYIWYLHVCSKETKLKLSNKQLKKLGVTPATKKRNLEKLEAAGYIKIENQRPGASVEITLINVAEK